MFVSVLGAASLVGVTVLGLLAAPYAAWAQARRQPPPGTAVAGAGRATRTSGSAATGSGAAPATGRASPLGTAAASGDDATPAPAVKVERGAGGEKIYRITEGIVITGKVHKPNAFLVLERSSINYEWESLKQNFLPKVVESVQSAPF